MSNRLLATVAAAALALTATGAVAATQSATFDLSLPFNQSLSHAALPGSFDLTDNGLTATFAAGAFRSIGFSGGQITSARLAPDPRIGRYVGGAGVVNSPTDGDHQADGNGWKDFISIAFDAPVTLSKVVFSFFGSNDDFRWIHDSSGNGAIGVGDAISARVSSNPYSGFGSASSSLFAIGAFDSDDEWKLKAVTVEFAPPAEVPLPAAGWLMLAALGGLAAARRRRAA